jgi:glucose-1-phosphate adenylyltransferase
MQFIQALDANTPHPTRRSGEGSGNERLMERLNIRVIKHEKSLRQRCFGGKVVRTAQCVLTPYTSAETLVSI